MEHASSSHARREALGGGPPYDDSSSLLVYQYTRRHWLLLNVHHDGENLHAIKGEDEKVSPISRWGASSQEHAPVDVEKCPSLLEGVAAIGRVHLLGPAAVQGPREHVRELYSPPVVPEDSHEELVAGEVLLRWRRDGDRSRLRTHPCC